MQVTISGHHVDVNDRIRNHVNSKLERIERHFERITSAQVILSKESVQHKAEANLHVAGNDLFADASADDLYAAIDGLMDKLDRQVRKHKEKLTDKHRYEKQRNAP